MLPETCREYTDTNWDVTTPKYQATPFKPSSEESVDSPSVADPNGPEFVLHFDPSAAKVDPYVLFPWLLTAKDTNKTDTLATPGFLQLPAKTLEPAFGKYWSKFVEPASAPEPEVEVYYTDPSEAASPDDPLLADEEENPRQFDDDLKKATAPSPDATML